MRGLRNLIGRALPEIRPAHFWEMAWVIAGQASAFIASLLTLKTLTSFLPPVTYGQLNLTLVATILPTWLLLSPLTQALGRWYSAEKEKGELGRLVKTVVVVHAIITIAACAVALIALF